MSSNGLFCLASKEAVGLVKVELLGLVVLDLGFVLETSLTVWL